MTQRCSSRFEEVSMKLGEADVRRRDGQAARASRPSCRTRSTPATAGSSTARSRSRWTRCAARRATPTSRRSPAASAAASRCAGCCCSSPTCCCSTSRPTTSTPRASRGSSASCRTTRARSSRSPTIATSSTTSPVDPRARPRRRASRSKGNYSSWLEQKAKRLAQEEKAESDAPARRSRASSSGCACRPRRARPRARPASAPTRSCSPRSQTTSAIDAIEITIPPGRASATSWSRPRS